MTEQQLIDVCNLRQSCQQAEDALSQGMDKLQQTLAETVAAGQLAEVGYNPRTGTAMDKLEALVSFVSQVRICILSLPTQVVFFHFLFALPNSNFFLICLTTRQVFALQADHLRQETLQQMSRILTTRQAARGLLALGEYFLRLRALSSLWANRPREPT